jgi:hypothetical protein
VVASAFKQSKDGTSVLRVYEAAGQAAKAVRVTLRFNLKQLHEANLIEDKGAPLAFERDGFTFDLKPFEIKTFKLSLGTPLVEKQARGSRPRVQPDSISVAGLPHLPGSGRSGRQ